ncbi:hypothetical protein PBI_FLOOF_31 [Microbacterium phage Floof]|uniref:Uncharacterized protein n=1 Tax=Microbacterium phage Floof TaxID=2201433 RepID=A0A2Z4Q5N6_9CAUD|nr:hypothetical protein PBI_FLOOF_31 [Microbacterium phage Floof]
MSHHLIETYQQSRPHILISLSPTDTEGSVEATTPEQAYELRRGLVTAFIEVSRAIRAAKRRARQERAAARRDQQRVEAYTEEAARG